MLDDMLEKLRRQLGGRLSVPGDNQYAAATSIWAKPVKSMPLAVVHCQSSRDIQLGLLAARNVGLPISVRGGGHDWAGRALCNGIVLDLSRMQSVVVNPGRRIARVAGGARIRDVLASADPLGLATATGSCSDVGMAGFMSGGGYGPLIGRFGLGCDNLIAADVVLADGRLLTANRNNNEELLWALRGGGGNFGIIASMQVNLHELPTVASGMFVFPFAEAPEVLERCAGLMLGDTDALSVQIAVASSPDEGLILMVVPTWSGEPEQASRVLGPLHSLGTLLFDNVRLQRYGESLSVFDRFAVNGRRVSLETCFLPTLEAGSSEAIVRAMEDAPSAGCAIVTHDFKGAAARVPLTATAFGLRRDHILVEIIASFDAETEADRHQNWTRDTRLALARYAIPGGYPNMLGPEETSRARQAFGPNAERLLAAKREFDPDNVFRSAVPLPCATGG